MSRERESQLSAAFVAIADTLAGGCDTVEMFTRLAADCARLLDVASAGLLLADRRGVLHLMAASSEQTHDLELFQLQREEGPCLDCYRDGVPVLVPDLGCEAARWPTFVPAALASGFASVHALPMRLHEVTLGALGLFGTETGPLEQVDLDLAQALVHVAGVVLMTERAAADASTINDQLQRALESRVLVEQAKGLLAQIGNLEMDQAFEVLNRYASDHRQRLSEVAAQLAARDLPARDVLDHTADLARPDAAPHDREGT